MCQVTQSGGPDNQSRLCRCTLHMTSLAASWPTPACWHDPTQRSGVVARCCSSVHGLARLTCFRIATSPGFRTSLITSDLRTMYICRCAQADIPFTSARQQPRVGSHFFLAFCVRDGPVASWGHVCVMALSLERVTTLHAWQTSPCHKRTRL